jgi:hypothetical protein
MRNETEDQMSDEERARRSDAKMEAGVRDGVAMAAASGVNAAAKAMYRQGISMPVVIRVLLYPQQRRAGDADSARPRQ